MMNIREFKTTLYDEMADEAIEWLNDTGLKTLKLEGGFPDWVAKNLPVETG